MCATNPYYLFSCLHQENNKMRSSPFPKLRCFVLTTADNLKVWINSSNLKVDAFY